MKRMNISIDDVSPHPMSGIDVVDQCFRVIEQHPSAKFTLFIPTAYWRTVYTPGKPDTRTDRPMTLINHPDFCDKLQKLPEENFEFGFHGRYHGIPGKSNNDEMRDLNAAEFAELCRQMRHDVAQVGLNSRFKQIIRPPAMYMSPAAINISDRLDIKCLALSPRSIHKKSYCGADESATHVVYANVWFPDDSLDNVTDNDLEVLYHACEWDKGYLNETRTDELLAWLSTNPVKFCFIEELLDG